MGAAISGGYRSSSTGPARSSCSLCCSSQFHHATGVDGDAVLTLHTSIALSAMLVLWFRVLWRVVKRHPDRLPTQRRSIMRSEAVHYILIAAIAVMLVTGPLVAWSGGLPLRFWVLEIPAIRREPACVQLGAGGAHRWRNGARMGNAAPCHCRHQACRDRSDGAFDRMMAPPRQGDAP